MNNGVMLDIRQKNVNCLVFDIFFYGCKGLGKSIDPDFGKRYTFTNLKRRQQMFGKIIGTGSYIPKRIITNEELTNYIDTSDEWITERTGVKKDTSWKMRPQQIWQWKLQKGQWNMQE